MKFVSVIGLPGIGKTTIIDSFANHHQHNIKISVLHIGSLLTSLFFHPSSRYYTHFLKGEVLPIEVQTQLLSDYFAESRNNKVDVIIGDGIPITTRGMEPFIQHNMPIDAVLSLETSMDKSKLCNRIRKRARSNDIDITHRIDNWEKYIREVQLSYKPGGIHEQTFSIRPNIYTYDVSPYDSEPDIMQRNTSCLLNLIVKTAL